MRPPSQSAGGVPRRKSLFGKGRALHKEPEQLCCFHLTRTCLCCFLLQLLWLSVFLYWSLTHSDCDRPAMMDSLTRSNSKSGVETAQIGASSATELRMVTSLEQLPSVLAKEKEGYASWVQSIQDGKRQDQLVKDRGRQETIFVAMASYRDDQCKHTLANLFEMAKYPERVRVGVFQQHAIIGEIDPSELEKKTNKNAKFKPFEDDCSDFYKVTNCDAALHHGLVPHPICRFSQNIRIDRISVHDARGPMYGRYRAEQFYNGEDYMLQIDAHTRFAPHWDNVLIDSFLRVGNEYAVISTYPKATGHNVSDWRAPLSKPGSVVAICKSKQLPSNKMFKHERGMYIRNPTGDALLSPFFAAGFSFAKGHRILTVPTDPYLPYLFDGEEILMTARLFTHGYDIYTPSLDVCYHIYEQYFKRPLFWNDDWNAQKKRLCASAQARVLHILGLIDKYPHRGSLDLREAEYYGMGKERSLDQFWQWIRMDFDKGETSDFKKDISKQRLVRIPTQTELLDQKNSSSEDRNHILVKRARKNEKIRPRIERVFGSQSALMKTTSKLTSSLSIRH